jgi:hypothetical protein
MAARHPEYAFHRIENKQAYKKAFEANRLAIDGDMLALSHEAEPRSSVSEPRSSVSEPRLWNGAATVRERLY